MQYTVLALPRRFQGNTALYVDVEAVTNYLQRWVSFNRPRI